jgi:hypothetical protein
MKASKLTLLSLTINYRNMIVFFYLWMKFIVYLKRKNLLFGAEIKICWLELEALQVSLKPLRIYFRLLKWVMVG